MSQEKPDPKVCIWKPPIRQEVNGEVRLLNFPCRYPDKEKTAENCTPCLMGDLFVMQYTQMSNIQKQASMNEEIMTFLRNMTSDGSLDDLT